MRKFLLTAVSVFMLSSMLKAQELNCEVSVIYPQIQGVNTQIFNDMEEGLFEFLNNKKWTNDKFTIEERITCSLILNITEARASSNIYKAELQIISSRPVYGTDYTTPVINIRDVDVTFEFTSSTQYNFNPDQYRNDLISIMAYYAYMVIGYDYDTYSLKGGTPFFQQAQRIVQSAQQATTSGWKAYDGDKNRYWLVENILHPTFEPMRECLYGYHRLGLDVMSEKVQQGRQQILSSVQKFNQIHRIKPLAYNTQQFFVAKSDELVNIFKDAPAPERNMAYETLTVVDPGNLAKYDRMQKGK